MGISTAIDTPNKDLVDTALGIGGFTSFTNLSIYDGSATWSYGQATGIGNITYTANGSNKVSLDQGKSKDFYIGNEGYIQFNNPVHAYAIAANTSGYNIEINSPAKLVRDISGPHSSMNTNNPHNGLGAIYMLDTGGADLGPFGVYGHSAIAMQDENGEWWFMSFEMRSGNSIEVPVFFYQLTDIFWNDDGTMKSANFLTGGTHQQRTHRESGTTVEVPNKQSYYNYYYDESSNLPVAERSISIYDMQIYIEGDFTKSIPRAAEYSETPPIYWLTGTNCAWLALSVLQESTTGETYERIDDYLWHKEPLTNTKERQKTIIPKYSINHIEGIFRR